MSAPNPNRPLDVVMACRAADLPILRLTVRALRRFLAVQEIHVFTGAPNFSRFRRAVGGEVQLHDEDQALPGMTLAELKALNLPGFPAGAGWYFQQFLKYCYCQQKPVDDFYLIWDADTIPLRPMTFFDEEGRMLFTRADENHESYFATYRKLLGEEPRREFSFISQHMIVQKSILREMLGRIEGSFPGEESWPWKIMRNLDGEDTNLFSEYETLGSYVKNHYPERATYRSTAWSRDGSQLIRGLPSDSDLEALAERFEFAAFESSQRPWRRRMRAVRRWWRKG